LPDDSVPLDGRRGGEAFLCVGDRFRFTWRLGDLALALVTVVDVAKRMLAVWEIDLPGGLVTCEEKVVV
jgi:hypothetical protein